MQLPVAVIQDGVVTDAVHQATPFNDPSGTRQPAEAWSLWTPEDWAAQCPGWTIRPLIDSPPVEAGTRAVQRPMADWIVTADAVTVTYEVVRLDAGEMSARLDAAREAKVVEIDEERDRRLASGAPYDGKHIDVSDKGRADLGGMSIAALLAQAGTVPWSGGYSQGWIAHDNTRVPLPSPAAGLTLAATVGDWYGRVVQHARDLKDDALTASDPASVNAAGGWPE